MCPALVVFEQATQPLPAPQLPVFPTSKRLARITGIILAYPNLKVRIESYTDNHGDDAYNLAISQERAQVVESYLISQGISSKMITAKGFGGTQPIASNEFEAGRQRNRRVKIIVSGDMIGDRVSSYSGSKLLNGPLTLRNNDSPGLQPAYNSDAGHNFALSKMAASSASCNVNEGPEKAFNGSASAGISDKWCSQAKPSYLQVDLGTAFVANKFVIRHAGAGGELPVLNTRDFNIQISANGRDFAEAVNVLLTPKAFRCIQFQLPQLVLSG